MNGDLSLSQSLGGLRIANPDEDELASPISPPPESTANLRHHPTSSPSSHSNLDSTHRSPLPHHHQPSGGFGFDPETYQLSDSPPRQTTPFSSHHSNASPSQSARDLNHRKSLPLRYQEQQSFHNNLYQQHILQAQPSIRPASGFYSQSNPSASSQHSYRYRDDLGSSDGDTVGYTRGVASRTARPIPPGAPARTSSRHYHPSAEYSDPNSGIRRISSHRVKGPTLGSSPGYDSALPFTANAPTPRTADEWQERGAAVMARQEVDASGQSQTRMIKKGVKDFNFGRTLGEGSYSTVLAATDRQNLKEYAIKVLDKRHIIKEKKVKYVNIERDTLNRLTEHPGVVRLYYTFQDERSLYFVLDLATGGELLGVWKKLGSFDVECTRFYGAEILDTIAYMHSRGVIHRDLKPENVLLDRDGHVRITDFGTAKILPDPKKGSADRPIPGDPSDGSETDRAISFVGTAEYVSPELLRDKNACKASDLWAFGCIIYQLIAGRPPFKAPNEYLTFQKILALEYTFPDGFPELARDLVERLLVLEPSSRLPVDHIKNHPFFEGIQWGKSLWKQKPPKLKPYVSPPSAPIKLNGTSRSVRPGPSPGALSASAAAVALAQSSQPPTQSAPAPPPPAPPKQQGRGVTEIPPPHRPQLRGITELPPPSQLDIDWSPVLTNNNERILKLGNLIVSTGSPTSSPTGKGGDPSTPVEKEKPLFSKLFSSSATKKRERLVLITSSARLVIAPAGGNEKKAKMEVNCLAGGTTWKSHMDAKGLTAWCLENREKHFTFEDPRATVLDPAGSKYSTQEWLDALEQARQLAIAGTSVSGPYSDTVAVGSSVSSPTESSGDQISPLGGTEIGRTHNLRQSLRRVGEDEEPLKGRKRFSRRHSKGGLAAVF